MPRSRRSRGLSDETLALRTCGRARDGVEEVLPHAADARKLGFGFGAGRQGAAGERRVDAHQAHALAVEAGVEAAEIAESPKEERGAAEQHDREHELDHDQEIAGAGL